MLTKKPDPIRSNFNYLQLAHTSTSLLNEDLKNSYLENDIHTPAVRFDKSSREKFNDSKCSYKFLIITTIHSLLLDVSHLSINRIAGRLNLSPRDPQPVRMSASRSYRWRRGLWQNNSSSTIHIGKCLRKKSSLSDYQYTATPHICACSS